MLAFAFVPPQALSTVFNDDLFTPLINFDRLLSARTGPDGRSAQLMRGIPIDVIEVSPSRLVL